MVILGIETSCDETSAAILKIDRGVLTLKSNVVSSQIDIHKKYGGVVPEVAARHHVENINAVIDLALSKAKTKAKDVDLIAVTAGPGLITSLMVGVEVAKALSLAWQKPLIGVNHMYAHLSANFYNQKIKFPALSLIVSGGHTELVLLKSHRQFKKIGQTVDDAAGEAFDKVAKILNLGYPGGPVVSDRADAHLPGINLGVEIKLPRPMIRSDDLNFSFSGLKTAVLYQVQKMSSPLSTGQVEHLCYEFQQSVVEVLVAKTIKAVKQHRVQTVMLSGGVAANKKLREALRQEVEGLKVKFLVPEFKLCTDNAGMIAIAGYYINKQKKATKDNWKKIKADPNWEL